MQFCGDNGKAGALIKLSVGFGETLNQRQKAAGQNTRAVKARTETPGQQMGSDFIFPGVGGGWGGEGGVMFI